MSGQQVLAFALIAGVVGCFAAVSSAGELWTSSESLCSDRVKSLDSVSKFIEFASEMEQTPELDSEATTKLINDCLTSYHGVEDVRAMKEMVEALPTYHSVCEDAFLEPLFDFHYRLTSYRSRPVVTKKDHGLLRLTSLIFGQVVLTCKKNLETKLEQAEKSDEALKESLDVVENDQVMREIVEGCLDTSEIDLPENLIPLKTLQGDCDSIRIPLNTQEEIEKFLSLKRSCKLIESYANGSTHPIELLARNGFQAGDKNDVTDNKLKSSPIVRRWLKAVQYCRGASLTLLSPDLLKNEAFGRPEPKSFELAEPFEDISQDLQCHFEPKTE